MLDGDHIVSHGQSARFLASCVTPPRPGPWRPGVTFKGDILQAHCFSLNPGATSLLKHTQISFHVHENWKHLLEMSVVLQFRVHLCWHVLTWIWMQHFWLSVELVQLLTAACAVFTQ